MKKSIPSSMVMLLTVVSFCALGAEKPTRSPVLASDSLVWAGLDYSMVRMVGPGQFNDGQAIFPGMLEAWNNLFIVERFRIVEKETKKRVIPDVAGIGEVNKRATPKQIISGPGPQDTIDSSHITAADIARAVKGYKLESKNGLGVVFIVDRLVKLDKKGQGAVYVVAFDIGSREVLFSQREVHNAAGFGFRNYWFRVIKDAERALRNLK